tara:strand:+ start:537 stop:761 length:225 start_codon:yes stop_codon:yes gene_type:complete
MSDKYVNKMVWTAIEPTIIIFGRVKEAKMVNSWLTLRVEWQDELPDHKHPEWIKAADVSLKTPEMLKFMFNECR